MLQVGVAMLASEPVGCAGRHASSLFSSLLRRLALGGSGEAPALLLPPVLVVLCVRHHLEDEDLLAGIQRSWPEVHYGSHNTNYQVSLPRAGQEGRRRSKIGGTA